MLDHVHLGQAGSQSHQGFIDSKVRVIKYAASQGRHKEIREEEGKKGVVKDKGFLFLDH